MPTPHTTQLIPCCCSQGAKTAFFSLTLCKRGLKGRSLESHTRAVSHRRSPEKGNGDNTERNSNSSPQPANLPPPSPREGQRDAPDSAQAAAFVSTQGKVRGSSGRPGRPPQGPAAGAAGTAPGHGRAEALQAGRESCPRTQTRRARALLTAPNPARRPSGSHTATVCPERSAPCPVMGESRTGLWHSLPKALQESHLDSA